MVDMIHAIAEFLSLFFAGVLAGEELEFTPFANTKSETLLPPVDYLFVNVDYSLVKVQKSDIAWIEGLRDYIKIHLISSPKPIMTRMSIKAIEEELAGSPFIRIHKSYLIAVPAITSVRKNSVFIQAIELPIGENYRETFFNAIGKTN